MITVEEMKADYDWLNAFSVALTCRDSDPDPVSHVTEIIACDAGENDTEDWIAIVGWNGTQGKYAVLRSGCCYTGWDCQGGGTIEFYNTQEEATSHLTLTKQEAERLGLN